MSAAGVDYCYHFGTFYLYDAAAQGYKVVVTPEGIIVSYLPEKATVEYRDGIKLHVYAGTYYQPVFQGAAVVYRVTVI